MVHCRAGQNRSVTTVVALLMMSKGWSLKRSYLTVKQYRPWIAPFDDNRKVGSSLLPLHPPQLKVVR